MAPISSEKLAEYMQSIIDQQSETIKNQNDTITNLNTTISEMSQTVANLEETIREFQRKLFGSSREKTELPSDEETNGSEGNNSQESKKKVSVSGHERKARSSRKDLYKDLPVKEVRIQMPEEGRFCTDCGAALVHMGYKFVREELRITPAKVEKIHYYQERLSCPGCREEDDTVIFGAKVPTALIPHSLASP